MITISLALLEYFNININEFLTLLKVKKVSEGEILPYRVDKCDIDNMILKGFLEEKNENYILPKKTIKDLKLDTEQNDTIEVLEYFKNKTGKKIAIDSKSNKKYVKDRLDQGYSKEDLKKVIDNKYKEWNGTDMDRFIRIQTLFNETKFQKYISSIPSTDKKSFTNVRRI